jgi:hypothetical protein
MQSHTFTSSALAGSAGAARLSHAPARPLVQALQLLRLAALTLLEHTRRVTDPVADCVREAAAVRREALRLMDRHPAMAADFLAAADRHEREGRSER